MIEVKGRLNFSVADVTRKHKNQSAWKRTAIIQTGCDLDKYYSWILKKRFSLDLNKNLRGTHVTIISDRMNMEVFNQGKSIFDKKEISFFFDPKNVKSNGKHWWIDVDCPDAENIRESMGLTRIPYFGFHLTIGHANELNILHSEYILNLIKKFGI